MTQQTYTKQQLAAKIKEKYPVYAEMDDNVLVDKITAKYPQYLSNLLPENEEPKIQPEVPTWLENTFGKDTFGIDFASDMYRAIKSGWNQSSAVGEIKDVFIGDRSDEALNDMRKALEDSRKSAVSEEMQEYQQLVEKYKKDGDSGFLAGFKALLQNPTIGPEVILSSGVGMIRTAFEAPELVGAGAATGAAAGAAGLGAGVAAGTFVGASTAAMTAMETTGTFAELLQEELKERGLDFSKNDDIRKVFEDEDAMFSIRSKALGRGIAIGAIEALTGGIAGKIGARAIGGTRKAIAGAAVKGTLVEATGGAIGETAGMLAAGQELRGEEILLEGLAGTVTAPGTIGLGYLSGKQEYSVNGKKIKGSEANGINTINEIIDKSPDEDFVGTKFKIKNNKDLEQKIQDRRKKIIKENKDLVKKKVQPETVTDLEKRLDKEIKKTEQLIKQVQKTDGGIEAEAFELRLKDLKEKKKGLNDQINFQIDQLSEEETLSLMNIDDDVSLYQSILNDPNSSDLAKQSAKEQLGKLKAAQLSIISNPDAADMANPNGPTKQKNIDLSEKTQKAYEAKGKNSWGEVAKHQAGLINSIATSMWSKVSADKKVGTFDDFKAALVSDKGGIVGLVKTYNPETGVPLAAYIANRKSGLPARANRIIKQFTKQDTQKSINDLIKTAYAEETNIDIELDSRINHEKLGLSDLLGDLDNDTEIGLQKVENDLKLLGEVTQKKRQSAALKSFNEVFNFKYKNKIKDFIGKNTKTKNDFSKFLKSNLPLLKKIALKNIDFQKGSSLISKTWNQVMPSDQDFLDYYEGADSPSPQTLSDRKTSLTKAITDQLATDARESYFEDKQEQRELFNEQQGISFQQTIDNTVEALHGTPGANIFMKDQEMMRNSDEINAAGKTWQGFTKQNYEGQYNTLDRKDPEFKNDFKKNFMDVHANKFSEDFWSTSSFAFYKGKDVNKSSIFGNKEGLNEQIKGITFDKNKPKLPKRFNYSTKKKLKTFGSGKNKLNIREYIKTEEFKNNEAQKLPALKNIFLTFQEILQEDPAALPYIIELLKDSAKYQGHFMRYLAPFKFFTKNLDAIIVEEHSLPQIIVTKFLLQSAIDGKVEENFKYIEQNYFQGALEEVHDNMLKGEYKGKPFNFQSKVLDGQMWDDQTWARYFNKLVESNGGIPPSNYELLNGKTIAEEFNVTSSGVLASLEMQEATKSKVNRKLQKLVQFQEDSLENFELSDGERLEALIDILQSQYPDKFVMTNQEDVVKYLMANYGYTKESAIEAMNQKGFRDPDIIYINLEKAGLDTPMHEFTHEWADLVNKKDPALFNAIYEKLKTHPRFAEAVERMNTPGIGGYSEMSPDSFNYKNEVMAYILGEEGASLYNLFEGDAEAKSLIDKFFNYIREALGFDPTTKNFADLTVNEVIKLSVKDIVEGNPAANFDKLKNKAEGKSWFAKTEANQSPSQRAKLDPILRAFNKIKLSYRADKNLAKAINEAYKEVQGLMEFSDFVKLVVDNTKESVVGTSKQLLIAKADVIKANKIAEESIKKLEEGKIKEENKSDLQNKFRRMIYTAAAEGAKVSKWFIPPNAEDFKGLLYTFLPKGQAGIEARKFLEENLLKPYSDGIAALDTEILNKSKAWEKMSKGYKFNEKVEGTPYTLGDAIKIYNAIQRGDDVTIAKQKHMDALIHAVESDQNLLDIAEAIEENFPINVKDGWQNKTLAKEIFDAINNGARDRALTTFSENVDAIFNDTTMDLIGDQFGNNFKQALKNTLRRMKSGRNRVSTDAQSNVWLNWINRAVGTTMFFNSRSALLQTISSLNFIGLKDNNIFKAAAAYANTKQFNEDYKKLWNSDYLRNRRDGAKFDVLADEIVEGDPKGLNKLLKNGFLPTRYADSFAIALGGAAFYRNRVNALVKNGMDVAQAEEQAMNDWRREAENSQQSADPSKISEIQASSLGRIIYAFANTPFQYARIVKRRLQDITSGRSAAEGRVQNDLGTILYYGAVQAVMFNALQSGLAALAFGDDDDDEIKKLKDKKYLLSIERGLTSFAKSLGNPGAISATLYSLLKEGYLQQTGQKRPDPNVFAITATSISPPINSKLRDLSSAYRAFNKIEEDDLLTPSLDSEALTMAGEVASFGGVPLDRVIRKARHLAAIKNEELELWQKIWLVLGWNEWDLGVDTRADKNLFKEAKFDDDDFEEAEFEESTFKKLKPGVAGVANNDGTIELDPNLSPEEKRKTIQHEKQHLLDMKNKKIKLNYDDNFVYYKDKKYKRANGNIVYNGKSYIEGHPDLPWEKRAYKAEKTKKFLYA